MAGQVYYNHLVDREKTEWTSFGKLHNEPAKKTLIKNLSDSHLMRIVVWIKDRQLIYDQLILKLMEDEVEYRTRNYIFIPDTY